MFVPALAGMDGPSNAGEKMYLTLQYGFALKLTPLIEHHFKRDRYGFKV
jgi:hypothetical protein